MQKFWNKLTWIVSLAGLLIPAALVAQDDKGDNADKEKKEVQQIIITRKGDKQEKVVVEINGDKVTINGKPLEEYKDKDGNITVNLKKLKDMQALTYLRGPRGGNVWNFNPGGDGFDLAVPPMEDMNRAMLGVTTEKADDGAEVQDITPESAAEKIGLKEGDIITKVDGKKITGPDDLAETIKAHKPGDKVTVNWLRDKKEMKATAELTKWKGISLFKSPEGVEGFKMDLGDMNFQEMIPRLEEFRAMPPMGGQNWSWSGGGPKLGLSVQDTDDGKGVKVVEVDEESNAGKAGLKEDDIITQVDDKAVNGVDEITRLLKDKKEQLTVRFQVTRGGKAQTIEVKMPRKIKTADL